MNADVILLKAIILPDQWKKVNLPSFSGRVSYAEKSYVLWVLWQFYTGCGLQQRASETQAGSFFGVGGATRWVKEKQFMEDRAKELGADITVRFNTTDTPKTWREDCFELIDSGINVLIMIPRDLRQVDDIVDYAKRKTLRLSHIVGLF